MIAEEVVAMTFRSATMRDLDRIEEIYRRIHDREESGHTTIGWIRSIYPTRATAETAIRRGTMYVEESHGAVVAAAKIDQEQVPEYADAPWTVNAPADEVLVLHTLVVDPAESGKGCATAFVRFYEDCALQRGCRYLRMDTNERNAAARALYRKLGYSEIGIVPCVFNGIPGVQLLCLEKTLADR